MRTTTIGHPLLELGSAGSTNEVAAELLERGEVGHGAVVWAHEQTAGRGQRGRTWSSEPGLDLTFSVVLKPRALRADAQFVLGKIAALAVWDVVRGHVPGEVRIKWPNDILVERRKVAGILIRSEVVGEWVQSAVVGIGLNVNSTGFPEELAATSLLLASGRMTDRNTLLEELCLRVEERWTAWQEGGREPADEYSEQLWARGRWAHLVLDGAPVLARPMDVDASGRLIVEHEDGRVGTYGLERLRFAAR